MAVGRRARRHAGRCAERRSDVPRDVERGGLREVPCKRKSACGTAMRWRCESDVTPLRYQCDIIVILMWQRCGTNVALWYFCYTPLRYRSDTDVAPICYHCDADLTEMPYIPA